MRSGLEISSNRCWHPLRLHSKGVDPSSSPSAFLLPSGTMGASASPISSFCAPAYAGRDCSGSPRPRPKASYAPASPASASAPRRRGEHRWACRPAGRALLMSGRCRRHFGARRRSRNRISHRYRRGPPRSGSACWAGQRRRFALFEASAFSTQRKSDRRAGAAFVLVAEVTPAQVVDQTKLLADQPAEEGRSPTSPADDHDLALNSVDSCRPSCRPRPLAMGLPDLTRLRIISALRRGRGF